MTQTMRERLIAKGKAALIRRAATTTGFTATFDMEGAVDAILAEPTGPADVVKAARDRIQEYIGSQIHHPLYRTWLLLNDAAACMEGRADIDLTAMIDAVREER